jgi:hypothetical protein
MNFYIRCTFKWTFRVIGLILKNIDFEHVCVLNLHSCVLDRHAVWFGYKAAHCVDSTRMRMIVFQTAAGMCLQHVYIVIK